MLMDRRVPANPDDIYVGWYACYMDGTTLEEFNSDGTSIPFRDIEKDKLKEFGLYGGGVQMMFDTRDGVMRWFTNRFSLYFVPYLINEKKEMDCIVPRTDQLYQDIIHYKHFVTYLGQFGPTEDDPNNKFKALNTPPVTDEFYMGYKCNMNTKFGEMHFQNVAIINLAKETVSIRLTLTPKFDFDGRLELCCNGYLPSPYHELALRKGKKTELEVIIGTIKINKPATPSNNVGVDLT